MPPVDPNEMTLSPKIDPISHSNTVPAISIDGRFPFDNSPMFEFSPTTFTDPSFHGGNQALHRDGSWDTFSPQSDFYSVLSSLPSLQNDGDCDISSELSGGNHGMLRSHSFGGSSDTQLMDGLHNSMTISTTTLQAQSLPIRFEDGLYDPSQKSESVSSGESLSEIQTESGTDPSSSFRLTFYKVTPNANTGAMITTTTGEGKKPRGRHGPLNKQQREQAARMRKAGSCTTCRRRKSKVSSPFRNNHFLLG
jgi:hypothetical protein